MLLLFDGSFYGFLDVLGGVKEWVDGWAVTMIRGEPVLLPGYRLAKGHSWVSPPALARLDHILEIPGDDAIMTCDVGFRCAKSIFLLS